MTNRRERLLGARLYLVCDERPDAFLTAVLSAGVDIIQLRMKDASSDEEIVAVGRRFARAAVRHGALFILNDRPDLVAATGADGVHVGQDDVPVADARLLLGPDRLIGLSTHTPGQVDAAAGASVDYIGVGPVRATPTKPGRPAVGLSPVRYAAERARVPFFAIGGIAPENVGAVREAGAERIAVVRALTEASDPAAAVRMLRAAVTAPVPAVTDPVPALTESDPAPAVTDPVPAVTDPAVTDPVPARDRPRPRRDRVPAVTEPAPEVSVGPT